MHYVVVDSYDSCTSYDVRERVAKIPEGTHPETSHTPRRLVPNAEKYTEIERGREKGRAMIKSEKRWRYLYLYPYPYPYLNQTNFTHPDIKVGVGVNWRHSSFRGLFHCIGEAPFFTGVSLTGDLFYWSVTPVCATHDITLIVLMHSSFYVVAFPT